MRNPFKYPSASVLTTAMTTVKVAVSVVSLLATLVTIGTIFVVLGLLDVIGMMKEEFQQEMSELNVFTTDAWNGIMKENRRKREVIGWNNQSGEKCKCRAIQCPVGPRGPPGVAGPDGFDGVPGEDGKSGLNGYGFEIALETGCILCPAGPRGLRGLPGAVGKRGDRGLEGESGRPGRRGFAGPPGERGDPGRRGDDGLPGPHGFPGADALMYPTIPGAKGPRGPQGPAGQPGDPGENGPNGQMGVEGHRGPRGVAGRPGSYGVPGQPGSRGAPGLDGSYCRCPPRSLDFLPKHSPPAVRSVEFPTAVGRRPPQWTMANFDENDDQILIIPNKDSIEDFRRLPFMRARAAPIRDQLVPIHNGNGFPSTKGRGELLDGEAHYSQKRPERRPLPNSHRSG